jgi:para-nitrobenzyl esterase
MKFVNKMKYIVALILFLAQAVIAQSELTNELIAPDGTFVGTRTPTGRQFLGIPYAEPPVGELRWAAPKELSVKPKRFVAREFGSVCVQPASTANFTPKPGDPMRGSEDCLYLNVYSSPDRRPMKPVMVWIHGGGFVTGSGGAYDAHVLAEKHDAVVVTINYRLGALGFLSHPALGEESGNLGLMDQQMALRWVRRNIAAFGGDPKRVTIFGESAGGMSVCFQLLSPASKGLYSRAIDQSGPCATAGLFKDRKTADQTGINFAKSLGCPSDGTNALDCLKKLPAETLASASPGAASLGGITSWHPVYGTKIVPQDGRAFASGNFNRVPFINGSNRDEGRLFALFALPLLHNSQDYEKNLRAQFGAKADKVLAEYPVGKYGSPALAYAAYMTDRLFACPALSASEAMSRHTQVYAYEFNDRKTPYVLAVPTEIQSLGAFHAGEIQYIFQTRTAPFTDPASFTPEQKRLSDRMQEAWVSFARDGVPSIAGEGSWTPVRPGRVSIKNFDTSGPAYVRDFAQRHKCSFWSSL